MSELPLPLARELEQQARQRWVRWDSNLWAEFLAGPALAFAHSVPDDDAIVATYLRLASMGVGMGYLIRASAGVNFFTLAWRELLPTYLAVLAPAERAETLAQLWNLGENLEKGAGWLRLVMVQQAQLWDGLDHIDRRLEHINDLVEGRSLGVDNGPLAWVFMAEQNRRFLPGAIHFVAPSLLCVHDRQTSASLGLWMARAPVVLGPMGCDAPPLIIATDTRVYTRAQKDVRWSTPLARVANEWRAAATLDTSQFVVATQPL